METRALVPFIFSEPIRTERLVLRMMTPADAADVHSYQSREDVCRYLLFTPRSPAEVAERVARNASATTLAAVDDYLQIGVELPARGGQPARIIGDVYFVLKSLENSGAEIGWTLHPHFAKRGYATEAASAVLDLAFVRLGLHRVVAELDPRNNDSIALCLRLGMRREAHFVGDLLFRGEWADTGVYAILEDEWAALRRRTPPQHAGTTSG